MAVAILSIALGLLKLTSRSAVVPTVSAPVGAQPKPAVAEKVTAQPSEKTETVLNKYGLTAEKVVPIGATINTNN